MVLTFVRALMVIGVWVLLPASVWAVVFASGYVDRIPELPDLTNPPAGLASEIYATDGTRVGGLLRGARPHVAVDQIPARVIFAFLAAEDDAFFEHDGYDLIAIARAFMANRAAGRVVEGGSTITQQVAKVSLGNERSYDRKIIEVLLARRMEAMFTKSEILEAYLNTIYLGAGAYGVRAAAEIYFDRSLDELSWAQTALIAGLTNSPSRRNPFRKPKPALMKRAVILDRLVGLGALSPNEAERYKAEPLGLREDWRGDEATMPYAAMAVSRHLETEYGEDARKRGGYQTVVAVGTVEQSLARKALAKGLGRLDRRQGFRGPLARLEPNQWGDFAMASANVYGVPAADEESWEPIEARPYAAIVKRVERYGLLVNLGGRDISIGRDGVRWAYPYSRRDIRNERPMTNLRESISPGDVVLVARDSYSVWDQPREKRRSKAKPRKVHGWRLDQIPKVEGVLVSAEVDTGYARAVVGGWDFDRSQFNRALRGCRQPGSVFKPIVYSRALELGMTPATVLIDTPFKIEKAGGEVWAPKNADRNFSGYLILRDALARSRNLPSVEVFNYVGIRGAARQAARLGITTRMAETEELSLGASCVIPWDMTRVYGSFARAGIRMEPRLILSIRDKDGKVLLDHGHFSDLSASTMAKIDRLVRSGGEAPARVLRVDAAFQLLQLLRAVVYAGTAYAATELGVPVAGKTGTTNAYDAWFVGFTESLVTTVWAGADGNERPLGKGEHGSGVALPIWMSYMRAALEGRHQGRIIKSVPEEIEILRVDREFGLRSKPGEPGVDLGFRRGTAPERFAPDRTTKAVRQVDREATKF